VKRQRLRVAFQGERGAFSEQAARRLLGDAIRVVPRPTFESLFGAIGERAADYALVPIENSLAGSIQRNYDLLRASRLVIVRETVLPIAHCLIGCRGASFGIIRSVESHPVALAQCERFFARHPKLRRIVSDDTAGSARAVTASRDPSRAAIAGAFAAELYGGKILRRHVEDHAENYTRFLLLAPSRRPASRRADKLSLVFRLAHRPGTLSQAIAAFAKHKINLVKIESRPLHGRPWEYSFYLDLQVTPKNPGLAPAMRELKACSRSLRILGHYASARRDGGAKFGD
jgi:prephenate dehydratase